MTPDTQLTDRERLATACDAGFKLACGLSCGCMDGEMADSHERDEFLASVKPAQPTASVSDDRQWLARQLLDANLTDAEAYSVAAFAPLVKDQWKPAQPTADVAGLVEVLRELRDLCKYATFDNGVADDIGRSEANYWADETLEKVDAVLAAYEAHRGDET